METPLDNNQMPSGSPLAGEDREPNFLLVRDSSGDWPQWKQAAIGSAIFHLVAITALFVIKGGSYETPPPERLFVPYVTKLYLPKELTQKAPNKGPLSKLLMAPTAPVPKLSEPAPKAAPPPAPVPKPQPPAPKPAQAPPSPPAPIPQPSAPAPVEAVRNQPPPAAPPPANVPKPEAPKMIVAESLQVKPQAQKAPSILAPSNPIQDAMRAAANGAAMPRDRVGDSNDAGIGTGLNLAPSATRPQSSLEIKSDPMGVDFRPYLLQVLQSVRTNWFAVYPEAARLGMRGRVVLEFTLSKTGKVVHVQFAGSGQSGAKALDQAAIAAISASDPLPMLPREFKGDSIVLAMTFMYNMPR